MVGKMFEALSTSRFYRIAKHCIFAVLKTSGQSLLFRCDTAKGNRTESRSSCLYEISPAVISRLSLLGVAEAEMQCIVLAFVKAV